MGNYSNDSNSKKTALILTFIVAISFIAFVMNTKVDSTNSKVDFLEFTKNNDTKNNFQPKREILSPPKRENWTYRTEKDKMEGKIIYFADCESSNKIEFEFPYNGGSIFYLTIRKKGGQRDVLLYSSKCQFMPGLGSSSIIKIKFDNDKPRNYLYSTSDDGSYNIIFIEPSLNIINYLKNSKKIMVEAQFYQAGWQIIEFNVEGLKWDYN